MSEELIRAIGESCQNRYKESIPSMIIRKREKGGEDTITIIPKPIPTNASGKARQEQREFYLYICEEPGGKGEDDKKDKSKKPTDGGGYMGEILDSIAKRSGRDKMPCLMFHEKTQSDVYVVTYDELCEARDLYRGVDKERQEITEAQRRARQANMDNALRKRRENYENRRKQRVSGR